MHMQLMNSYRIPFSTLVSYIPVLATIVTTFFQHYSGPRHAALRGGHG